MELQAKAAQPAKMEELQVQTARKRQKRTRLFENPQSNSKAFVRSKKSPVIMRGSSCYAACSEVRMKMLI
ncbi:hypothetical protein J23TS9_41510 [Paenibacillus sp. J23TS9]|nr:hypothetical protein J23TS9_41510 [Paenibacillus sp. J23TS9]